MMNILLIILESKERENLYVKIVKKNVTSVKMINVLVVMICKIIVINVQLKIMNLNAKLV